MINTQIKPFNATAFKNGEFVDITEQDVLGKWAVFSSTLLTLLLFAQQNLGILRIITKSYKNVVLRCTQYQLTLTLLTKHGMTALTRLARSTTTW